MTSASTESRWHGRAPSLLMVAVALGVAVRALLLVAPPIFLTDVAYYNSQAVALLLHGVDPYGATYAVPPALATPGASDVFAYLPGVFAFLVPGNLGPGARLGLVACDVVIAASMASMRGKRGVLVAAAFLLFPPTVLFSTSFLNDSLPAIAFLAAAVALEARGRSSLGAAAFGLALGSSQECWFVFPLYAAYVIRRGGYRFPLISAGVGAALVAPFALWNPGAFVFDTLLFQFQRPVDAFLYTGPFGLSVNPSLQGILLGAGVTVPLALRGVLAGVVLAVVIWRSGKSMDGFLMGSAIFVAASLFVLSGDFFWSYLELPFALLLFWGARMYGDAGPAPTLKEPVAAVGPASQ